MAQASRAYALLHRVAGARPQPPHHHPDRRGLLPGRGSGEGAAHPLCASLACPGSRWPAPLSGPRSAARGARLRLEDRGQMAAPALRPVVLGGGTTICEAKVGHGTSRLAALKGMATTLL